MSYKSTYPPAQVPRSGPAPSSGLNRDSKDKGKGRARDVPFDYFVQAGKFHPRVKDARKPGFEYQQGFGNVCIVCDRICIREDLHKTLTNGKGCVDVEPPESLHGSVQATNASLQPYPDTTRSNVAAGPVVQRGSVDMGLRQMTTNDSLLVQNWMPSGMLGQEESSTQNMPQEWVVDEENGRRLSESGGLFW